jgi:hypothetical protein
MSINKPPVKKSAHLNVSIHRDVLATTQDFLSAVIVEFIHYRYLKNDRKPVWLKIDWIREKLPYISRAGLAKKLKKLVKDGHIVMKKGEGRHYHKCFYSPSEDMIEACSGGSPLSDTSKVYYNLDLAEKNLEASVIYAAIINLLRTEERPTEKIRGIKGRVGLDYGRVEDKLLLDYKKLAEGSGLSLSKVRKGVKWLIDKGLIDAKNVFGNKRLVSLPSEDDVKPTDLESYLSEQLPTESYPHVDPEEDPAEY